MANNIISRGTSKIFSVNFLEEEEEEELEEMVLEEDNFILVSIMVAMEDFSRITSNNKTKRKTSLAKA